MLLRTCTVFYNRVNGRAYLDDVCCFGTTLCCRRVMASLRVENQGCGMVSGTQSVWVESNVGEVLFFLIEL